MNKISLAKKLFLLFSVVFFASCDKEFNSVGANIVDDDYFNFTNEFFEVDAYDSITGPVQTSNLKINSLGIYSDALFGNSASHFVTQAELPFSNVTINSEATVDSVWVYVPYFSKQTGTNSDGIREFELDSVYGGETKFRLKVYENGYYLGNFNPDNENGVQRYYSNDKSKVESNLYGVGAGGSSVLNGAPLNDGPIAENTNFFFNDEEKIIYKTNGAGVYVDANGAPLADPDDLSTRVIKERFAPGMWISLNKEYFTKKILEAPAASLSNNNNFKSHFRGLYFQVEAITPGVGAMAHLDFSKGYIKMTYKMDAVDGDHSEKVNRSLKLMLAGNTINFFDTDYVKPTDPNRLFLKGGQGSVAYINMFGADGTDVGTTPDQLDYIKENNWMINEANLTFYIDDIAMGGRKEPHRIYLYDAKNKRPIVDYFADGSTNSANVKYNKKGFGGIIEKEPGVDGRGIKYKVRLTEYVRSCIEKDSTNFKLGLVVTEDINTTGNAYMRPPSGQEPTRIVPVGSVMHPFGTVLYGSSLNIIPEKRLKLEIYYTKPD